MVYENLIAYYPFTGNALDRSGNDNDGSITSTESYVTDRLDNADSSFNFNGIDNKINLGTLNNQSFSNGFTISMWIKTYKEKLNSESEILGKDAGADVGIADGNDWMGRQGVDASGGKLISYTWNQSDYGSKTFAVYGYQSSAGAVAGTYTIKRQPSGTVVASGNLSQRLSTDSDRRMTDYIFVPQGENLEVEVFFSDTRDLTIQYISRGNSGYDGLIEKASIFQLYMFGGAQVRTFLNGVQVTAGTSNEITPNNVWQHICFTYDNSKIKLYKDGIFVRESSYAGPLNTNTNDIILGKTTSTRSWWGAFDDVMIFDKALSDKEVKQLFNDNISIRKDLKVFAQEFVEPQSIPIVRDYAIVSKTNNEFSGIGVDFITNGGGEIDVSAFEEADSTLGNFAVEGEIYTSNASIYPTTFEYTYVNNDRGVNGVFANVTGSWIVGWNKVYFKPRVYSSLGNIPWNTMKRLEIYRSGGSGAVADFGIKNLCLIKFEDNKDIDDNLQLMKNGSVECKEINEYDVVTKTSITNKGELKTGEILEV